MLLRGMLVAVCCAALGAGVVAQEPDGVEIEELDGLDELDDLEAELDALDAGGGAIVEDDATGLRVTSLRGFLETRSQFFFRDRDTGDLKDEKWINELELELDIAVTDRISAYFRPRFLIDVLDDDLTRTDPLELYATWIGERWDLRAGMFVENWGIADTFNPVDVLNRRDLATDPLDAERLGEIGARFRYLFDGGETIGEPTVSLYVVPVFQAAEFPTPRSRWSFAPSPNRLDEGGDVSPDGAERVFLAARAQSTLTTDLVNADLQLVGARGPERFPIFAVSLPSGPGAVLTPVYYGQWTLGGGLRAVPNADGWSDYTLKAEVVYKVPYRTHDTMPVALPDEYLQYAFGFDRLFPNVFSDRDQITATVEWVGETGANDSTSVFRPFDDDVVFRGLWEANDFARSSLELRGFLDPKKGEWVLEGVFERQLRMVHEDLKLALSVQVFDPSRSEPGFFGLFPNNSNVELGLRMDF